MAERVFGPFQTPLGFVVSFTESRWLLISETKHSALKGLLAEVSVTLERPEQVRKSRRSDGTLLFYRLQRPKRWLCAVVKLESSEGVLITAYPTDAVKIGDIAWPN